MRALSLVSAVISVIGFASAFDTLGVDQKSGMIDVGPSPKDSMFYWMFYSEQSRAKDPLVIWLTGGPGCASEIAVFMENGPYKIKGDQTMSLN